GRPLVHLLLVHLLCPHCLLAKLLAQIARFPPDETADHNACPKNHGQHDERNGEPHDEQGSAYHHGEYLRQQARWAGTQSWPVLSEPLRLFVELHHISKFADTKVAVRAKSACCRSVCAKDAVDRGEDKLAAI